MGSIFSKNKQTGEGEGGGITDQGMLTSALILCKECRLMIRSILYNEFII
jgi:hypothetical protein